MRALGRMNLLLLIATFAVNEPTVINVRETVIIVAPQHNPASGALFNCSPYRETATGGFVRSCEVNP